MIGNLTGVCPVCQQTAWIDAPDPEHTPAIAAGDRGRCVIHTSGHVGRAREAMEQRPTGKPTTTAE